MNRLLVIGLDGTEPSLVEKWIEDGSLPNLKNLHRRGAYSRLKSPGMLMPDSASFCFYTSQNPAVHGAYNFLVWRPETMLMETPSLEWLPLRPFWRSLGTDAPRAIIVDAPHVYAPEPFHGVEVTGWATLDTFQPFNAYPLDINKWIRSHHGHRHIREENYDLLRKQDFLDTRDHMLAVTRKLQDMCLELMNREAWELLVVCPFTAHLAGHRLWDLTNIVDALTEAEKIELSDALRQVYIACDTAIGRWMESAGTDTNIMVFSLHGMAPAVNRSSVFSEMVERILQERAGPRSKPALSALQSWRARIPNRWRYKIKQLLPIRWRFWLTSFWRVGSIDWKNTKAFCLLSDSQGWIRINLKGREAQGIVQPGEEYENLCRQISEGLKTFVDADTGKPVVKEIVRARDAFKGEKIALLPDLIINWANSPSSQHRMIVSQRYGSIPWPTPGRNPEGRSGNHTDEGFLFAAGPDIKPDKIDGANIFDLAPTMLALLGQPIPAGMEGRVLPIIKREG